MEEAVTPAPAPQEDLAAVDERHLREARLIQARALEALRRLQIRTAAQAVSALDRGIRIERAILFTTESEWARRVARTRQGKLW